MNLSSLGTMEGIVVLTTKSFGNEDIAIQIKDKIGQCPLIILQNGINIERDFLDRQFCNIYRGVLFATSQVLVDGIVRFRPVSPTLIGSVNGSSALLDIIVTELDNGLFPFQKEENIEHVVWKKAIMNIVFNSICPLLDVDNGIFHRDAGVMELSKKLISTCISIAMANGVELQQDVIEEGIMAISKASEGQLISTLQDIKNGRPTEIRSLNMEMYAVAKKYGMQQDAEPLLLLGQLVSLIEKNAIVRKSK